MRSLHVYLGILALLVLIAIVFTVWAWHSGIAPIGPPAATSFDRGTVLKGAELATMGDCNVCHTAQGGKAFAGGRALPTPFGSIYSTNITPDAETGIGRWSEAAFSRAMREGLDRAGRHLYPAFPYDYFTHLTDGDIHAIYAFLMTREPVHASARANELRFPFNLRPLLAAWKLLFLKRGEYQPDASQSARWNRGAYLATALAHCGACHTPRNMLGGEEHQHVLAGGDAEGWRAPALNANSPAPVPWSADQLYTYLRTGLDDIHEATAGPMVPVVHDLGSVPEENVRAIVDYITSVAGAPSAERQKRAQAAFDRAKQQTSVTGPPHAMSDNQPLVQGAAIYAGACSECHDNGRQALDAPALKLSLSTSIAATTPLNLLRIVDDGIMPREGERGPWMPAFGGTLTDEELTALAIFLRSHFSDRPAWGEVAAEVGRIRQGKTR